MTTNGAVWLVLLVLAGMRFIIDGFCCIAWLVDGRKKELEAN